MSNSNSREDLYLIYSGQIKLKSAMHIGTGEDTLGIIHCLLDENQLPFIPGTSLAGVFLSDLTTIVSLPEELKKHLTGKDIINNDSQNDKAMETSILIFQSSHLDQNKNPQDCLQIRHRIRLDPRTKTVYPGGKFAFYEVPPDTVFPFTMIMDLHRLRVNGSNPNKSNKTKNKNEETVETQVSQIIDAIEKTLSLWMQGFSSLGGHTGSGNGHFELEQCIKISITPENYIDYISDPLKSFIKQRNNIDPNINPNFNGNTKYTKYTITIELKSDEVDSKCYGFNPLLIRQGETMDFASKSDMPFVKTKKEGKRNGLYYIPGSTVKGVLRSLLSRIDYKDPKLVNPIESLFGSDPITPTQKDKKSFQAGRWKIKDLYFVEEMTNEQTIVHRHSEDEFARSTFGSSKFDEAPLFYGSFKGELIIKEYQKNGSIANDDQAIDVINAWGEKGWIRMGAVSTPVILRIKAANDEGIRGERHEP